MHTILLTPQDVLFFRDARPMLDSLMGHTAYWPLPHIFNHALLSAFHRADLDRRAAKEKYGSLITAGPFPVSPEGDWYLPVPADLVNSNDEVKIGIKPVKSENPGSLPKPLSYALGVTVPHSKDGALPAWINVDAYKKYLYGKMPVLNDDFKKYEDIGDNESRIGIGINPDTQAQNGRQFYSAQYLRLKEGWRLGCFAEACDKKDGDFVEQLLVKENKIIIGGQQGICSIEKTCKAQCLDILNFAPDLKFDSRFLKWVLLTPAIFPEIAAGESSNIRNHPGGWLPNWIDPENGNVLLRETVDRKPEESREAWRKRVREAGEINGRLIAARIPGAIEVSGWNLGCGKKESGAKPTQLAVLAGAVYYFECDDEAATQKLAGALNFPNRRSPIFGEKGFGVGVCAPVPESDILQY